MIAHKNHKLFLRSFFPTSVWGILITSPDILGFFWDLLRFSFAMFQLLLTLLLLFVAILPVSYLRWLFELVPFLRCQNEKHSVGSPLFFYLRTVWTFMISRMISFNRWESSSSVEVWLSEFLALKNCLRRSLQSKVLFITDDLLSIQMLEVLSLEWSECLMGHHCCMVHHCWFHLKHFRKCQFLN